MRDALTLADALGPRSLAAVGPGHEAAALGGSVPGAGRSLALANAEMFTSLQSDDFREGVSHFQDRRLPRFTGQ
jgi:hypothetical protein